MNAQPFLPLFATVFCTILPAGIPAQEGDFNDDGFADLAIGVPNENSGGDAQAGAVHVLYGGLKGLSESGTQLWHQDSPGVADATQSGDRFGHSLATGNFDCDDYMDLAIGAPGEDLPGASNAGVMHVLYGSSSGLVAAGSQLWHQDVAGVLGFAGSFDAFGHSLAAGDFSDECLADLAIGVPFEDVAGIADAGAVNVLYGSETGLTAEGDQYWNEDSPGVLGQAEQGDLFGYALAATNFNYDSSLDGDETDDLAIGAPGEDVLVRGVVANDAGEVHVLYGSEDFGLGANGSPGDQVWSQNPLADVPEQGDRFGHALTAGLGNRAYLAIGVPSEDVGSVGDAGAVNVIYRSFSSSEGLTAEDDQFFHQDVRGVDGIAKAGDKFGSALASGNFDHKGNRDLAIGVPNDDFAGTNGGAVNVLYAVGFVLSVAGDQLWTQNSSGIAETAEAGDGFGMSLAAVDFDGDGRDDLAIGAPLENRGRMVDAGVVHALYGSDAGIVAAGDQLWHQDSFGIPEQAEAGDGFGSAMGQSDDGS